MKYIISCTAFLGSVLGASFYLVNPDQSFGALDQPLKTVSQIISPVANAAPAPVAGGTCIFYSNQIYRGRTQTVRYQGRRNGSSQVIKVANLSFKAASYRLRGTATLGLFSGRNAGGRVLTPRPETGALPGVVDLNNRHQIRRASRLSSAKSAACGIFGSVRTNL